ncbi:carbon monoxide dehydrogenase subunit G [Pseudoflavitalea sp. X16]|uniref:CoxG family protein n=1 Tax=Paraflavitalea devenefica TaxID=2716334 RepID=UPI0014216E09|nr:carbon monoxide dehydrogenase subunit G [Paraflavitalea devenefica]NII28164.1 carbon monoxide dehydrogenase subunit G [Paraflavitalea devenefica]
MQFSGEHTLNAAPPIIWAMLMDIDTLAKVVPGISHLEKTGDNTYKSTLDIKLGPVNGSFTGNLLLDDLNEPAGFTLRMQQNSKIGNANATIKINLLPVDNNQTKISFDGDVKLSGLLASMGQRVMGGVSNTLAKQFFENIEKELGKEPVH